MSLVAGIDGELEDWRLGVSPGTDDAEEVGVPYDELEFVCGGEVALFEEAELLAEDRVALSLQRLKTRLKADAAGSGGNMMSAGRLEV